MNTIKIKKIENNAQLTLYRSDISKFIENNYEKQRESNIAEL